MTADAGQRWERYRRYSFRFDDVGIALDISRMAFDDEYLAAMRDPITEAVEAMTQLEAGAIANPDEGRMVGHYWLRAPSLAPTPETAAQITGTLDQVRAFVRQVHDGSVRGAGGPFRDLIHIGIGGSALGPQLLCDAAPGTARIRVHFLDSADPEAITRTARGLRAGLAQALVSVASKSGGTPTPRHLMAELIAAYQRAGLDPGEHFVATTMPGSELDRFAVRQRWLARFALWSWVGGRTSISSAVGLLPAALRGADTTSFLTGAAAMDRLTRTAEPDGNPAALLALMWYWAGRGRGTKDMVVLPYHDRLALFPRFVQQLVMESVGKRLDRRGRVVGQGLTVYGYKGDTDQHSYLQQLTDGTGDAFVTFIRVHQVPQGALADHLFGNLEGTREALHRRGRESLTISLDTLDTRALGALTALYERAVGLYAELLNVNAYHQPGVATDAAQESIARQRRVLSYLAAASGPRTAREVASGLGDPHAAEPVHRLLEHLAVARRHGVRQVGGSGPEEARFTCQQPKS